MEGGYTCLPHLYQGKAEMLKTIMEFSYQGPKGNKLLLLFNISKTLEILKVTMQCINYPYEQISVHLDGYFEGVYLEKYKIFEVHTSGIFNHVENYLR